MKPLTKSKARVKSLGEVFTPPALVNEMLDKLPTELFTASAKTFIDPACGDGNFLVEVLQRKIDGGSSPSQALSTTYGIDIMMDNVVDCRKRLLEIALKNSEGKIEKAWTTILKKNIAVGDALKFDTDDIFSDTPSEGLQQLRTEKLEEFKQKNSNIDPMV